MCYKQKIKSQRKKDKIDKLWKTLDFNYDDPIDMVMDCLKKDPEIRKVIAEGALEALKDYQDHKIIAVWEFNNPDHLDAFVIRFTTFSDFKKNREILGIGQDGLSKAESYFNSSDIKVPPILAICHQGTKDGDFVSQLGFVGP